MQLPREQLPHLPPWEISQRRCTPNEVQSRTSTQPSIKILWFNLECPDRFNEYRDPVKIRNLFLQNKKGKGIDRPAYVKLWFKTNKELFYSILWTHKTQSSFWGSSPLKINSFVINNNMQHQHGPQCSHGHGGHGQGHGHGHGHG